MILVDSSVWIDYFRGVPNPQTDRLDELLGLEALITGDIVLAEVLQGFSAENDFLTAHRLMTGVQVIDIAGPEVAVQAARNYRTLRALGVTVEKTIDTLIATRCLQDGLSLLYSDRDFDPFVQHLGLRPALSEA